MSKLVSVIIPFFSNIAWLEEALISVLNQTYKNFEVILINDGSSEDLSDLINDFQGSLVYIVKDNGGPASARNLGIERSNGDFIAFLDSDDIWHERKLEEQVTFMLNERAIWSHTNYIHFENIFSQNEKKLDLSLYQGSIFPEILMSTHIATPSVMIVGDYIRDRQYLRFSEKMRYGQDYYLWVLLSYEAPLFLVPQYLCYVRGRGTNAAKRARVHIQVRAQLWENLNIVFKEKMLSKRHLFIIGFIYWICSREYAFIKKIENIEYTNRNMIEFVSRLIFVFPYLLFHLFFWIYTFGIRVKYKA